MMNCFCGMVDWQKAFSLISRWDHCQRSSPSWISNMLPAGYEPAQNLSSGFLEWSCAVVITITPWHQKIKVKNIKVDEKSYKNILIYYIGWENLCTIFSIKQNGYIDNNGSITCITKNKEILWGM